MDRSLPSLVLPVLDQSPALRQRAFELGLWCLDESFHGWRERHRFICSHGHPVTITPRYLVEAFRACPTCKAQERLQELKARAALFGVQCMNLSWHGSSFAYSFRCKSGHTWRHKPSSASCPYCHVGRAARHTDPDRQLKRLRDMARLNGGACLSDGWSGDESRYQMRCAEGHEWWARAVQIFAGRWCKQCSTARQRTGIDAAKRAALRYGGQCLSTECPGGSTSLWWRCAEGHHWSTSLRKVLRGDWCPQCADLGQVFPARPPQSTGHAELLSVPAVRCG